jgi:hypothetical protein
MVLSIVPSAFVACAHFIPATTKGGKRIIITILQLNKVRIRAAINCSKSQLRRLVFEPRSALERQAQGVVEPGMFQNNEIFKPYFFKSQFLFFTQHNQTHFTKPACLSSLLILDLCPTLHRKQKSQKEKKPAMLGS